ncbi:S41 family peptidase [Marinicella sp. W31]|uniref:S41 family peptidase n=1 Tax=Marinicella sp. W31 TaxID=3023713 RepID=UPI003756815A
MKSVIALLLFVTCQMSFGQSLQTERLSLLAKAWGVAKYYHSGACSVDYDRLLLDAIDSTIAATDKNTFNASIQTMLDGFGTNTIANSAVPNVPENLLQPIDRSWLQSAELTSANQQRLQNLISAFRPRENCTADTGNVNEGGYGDDNAYFDDTEPDVGVRLLGLFRFWNIIEYFYTYKSLMDQSWTVTLDEFIPQVVAAEDLLSYTLAIARFVAKTDDTHVFVNSTTMNNYYSYSYLPFVVRLIEGKTTVAGVDEDYADQLQIGDIITAVNGRSITEVRAEQAALIAGSNPTVKQRYVDYRLNRGEAGETMIFSVVKDNGDEIEVSAVYGSRPGALYRSDLPKWTRHNLGACDIGYIHMGQLETADVATVMSALNDTDAIIFDIRNYPRGTLWTLVSYLFPENLRVAKFEAPDMSNPGAFRNFFGVIGSNQSQLYQGRLLILQNADSISQSEYTIMGLEQHPNAVKIGSQTAAADGNVTPVFLPGQMRINFTGLGVFYTDNTPTQRVGIVPDVVVMPSIQGLKDGRDEVLETALNCDRATDLNWPPELQVKSGIYVDPSSFTKGIDITAVGEQYAVVHYDYREDGSPMWTLATARVSDGVLSIQPGGQSSFSYSTESEQIEGTVLDADVAFDFKRGPFEIDCATDALDAKQAAARMQWSVDGNAITRCTEEFIFSTQPPSKDFTGLWWSGSENPQPGISLHSQGDTLMVIIYYYDENGESTWAFGSGALADDGIQSIDLYKTSNGACRTCPPRQADVSLMGAIELSLTEATQEQLDENWISIDLGDSIWNRTRLPIRMFSNPQ